MLEAVEVLIAALRVFDGTLCFISHDVYFIRQIANHIIHVEAGRITHYPGDYDYFLQRKAAEDSEEGALFRAEEVIEAETRKRARTTHAPGTPDGGPRAPARAAEEPVVAQKTEFPAVAPQDRGAPSGPKSREQKRREAEERNVRHRIRQEKKKLREAREKLEWEEQDILKLMGRPETHRDPKRVTELMIRLGELRKALGRSE